MQEPLRVAVCEDTPSDQEKLLDMLQSCSIQTNCTVFSSGEALLSAYKPQMFDLLLADIYLNGSDMTGIDTVSRIRELGDEIPVAFITTSLDFTLESYRLSALKYIEKPFKPKEIEDILSLALLKKNSAPALSVLVNRKEERIPYSRIVYIEQERHHMHIYLNDASNVQVCEKLTALLPLLEEAQFFSPHKSYAVNLSYVRFIDPELKCFVMQNGQNIPIRRESMGQAKKTLETYLFSRTRGLSS